MWTLSNEMWTLAFSTLVDGAACGGGSHNGGARGLPKRLCLDTTFIEIFLQLCSAVTGRLDSRAHTFNRKIYHDDDTVQSHGLIQSKFSCHESRPNHEIHLVRTTTNEATCSCPTLQGFVLPP